MDTLKPCRFCGGRDLEPCGDEEIQCLRCHARVYKGTWNASMTQELYLALGGHFPLPLTTRLTDEAKKAREWVASGRVREAVAWTVRYCTPDIGNPMVGDYERHVATKIIRVWGAYLASKEKKNEKG